MLKLKYIKKVVLKFQQISTNQMAFCLYFSIWMGNPMYRISGMTGFPRFGLCMYEMPSFPLGVLSEACVLLGQPPGVNSQTSKRRDP